MKEIILCPICKEPLKLFSTQAICTNNHQFDRSKSGYFNLLITHKKNHGDNKVMILARDLFLRKGYYDFLIDECVSSLSKVDIKSMIDVGCGQGYYTEKLNEKLDLKDCLGIDISKEAIFKASKSSSIQYIIASISNCPVKEESFDLLFNGFAPKFLDESLRIVNSKGLLMFVDVGVNHLIELKEKLYDTVYLNKLEAINHPQLELIQEKTINQKRLVVGDDLQHLLKMTPYFYKTSKEKIVLFKEVNELETTFEFTIRLYRKKTYD